MKHLIVVVKNPVPGTVKTRLQTRYTPEQAAEIYAAFVRDVCDTARKLPCDRRIIAYDPPDAQPAVQALCGDGWHYVPQVEADLGVRMRTALQQQFGAGASRAVLIGTDIPSLPASHITRAFEMLDRCDVVLGPSTDGGYFLVGQSRPCPEIFENITWSTHEVFAQTVAQIETHGYSLGLIPPWFDVDTPEELDVLIAHSQAQTLATGSPPIKHTRTCLSTLT